MVRKSPPRISASKWAVTDVQGRAQSYTRPLTLRKTVQQQINSQVKQLQPQELHLNTVSGVILQPLALPRQKTSTASRMLP